MGVHAHRTVSINCSVSGESMSAVLAMCIYELVQVKLHMLSEFIRKVTCDAISAPVSGVQRSAAILLVNANVLQHDRTT